MVEIVVERGYDRVTVREISRVAGVSTRAFYEHYSGKEECLLRVHRDLARRLLRQVATLAETASDDDRPSVVVEAIIEWLGRDWRAARFLLVGPFGAGSSGREQLRFVERSLGETVSRYLNSFAVDGGGSAALIANGIATGLLAATRSMMMNGEDVRRPDIRGALLRWALSLMCSSPELEALQAAHAKAEYKEPYRPASSVNVPRRSPLSGDDLTLLHSATIKLSTDGDELLTRSRICVAAGVSRRSFDAHFTGIDNCLVSVAIRQLDLAIESIVRSLGQEVTPESGVSRGLEKLCDQLAGDPALAHLCFGDAIQSGEWLTRRDGFLTERLIRFFELVGAKIDSAERRAFEISLGAVLGLLQSEIAAGRAACLGRKTPPLVYMLLAPTSSSFATGAVCEVQR
jgi:AcrR family transcriptional regulator